MDSSEQVSGGDRPSLEVRVRKQPRDQDIISPARP